MIKNVLEVIKQLYIEFSRSSLSGFRSLYSVQKMLKAHYPASDNFWRDPMQTIEDVNSFPRQLLNLNPDPLTWITCKDLPGLSIEPKRNISLELITKALNDFGSDKAKTGLAPIYKVILSSLPSGSNLLEIGIGTNNPMIISSMGKDGRPGASLSAYEFLLDDIFIFGVDIDPNIMFATKSIKTTVADQNLLSSLINLPEKFNVQYFDLIIDDGLHSPKANLNSLLFGLEFSKPGGLIWLEDIPERSLEIWWLVKQLIKNQCSFFEIVKINENGFGVLIRTKY